MGEGMQAEWKEGAEMKKTVMAAAPAVPAATPAAAVPAAALPATVSK